MIVEDLSTWQLTTLKNWMCDEFITKIHFILYLSTFGAISNAEFRINLYTSCFSRKMRDSQQTWTLFMSSVTTMDMYANRLILVFRFIASTQMFEEIFSKSDLIKAVIHTTPDNFPLISWHNEYVNPELLLRSVSNIAKRHILHVSSFRFSINISSMDTIASSIISVVILSSESDRLVFDEEWEKNTAREFPYFNVLFRYIFALTRVLNILQGFISFLFG